MRDYLCLRSCMLFLPVVIVLFLHVATVYGQVSNGTSTISSSLNLLINEEGMYTIKLEDENDLPLNGEDVTVAISNSNVITVSILDPVVGSTSQVAKTDNKGEITAIIAGLQPGTSSVSFSVEDDMDILPNQLAVNVIGIDARITLRTPFDEDRPFSEAPFTMNFTDDSIGDNIINRQWDFDDGSPVLETSDVDISHEFSEVGVHNVTLTVTSESDIGDITDSDTVAICAFPRADRGGPTIEGSATINGVVFLSDPLVPMPGATVTLSGTIDRVTTTRFNGRYKFRNVIPGNYTIFACKLRQGLPCKESDITVNVDSTLKVDFQLERETTPPQ